MSGDIQVLGTTSIVADRCHYGNDQAAIKVSPGRSRVTVGQDGWEALADFALEWALSPVAGRL